MPFWAVVKKGAEPRRRLLTVGAVVVLEALEGKLDDVTRADVETWLARNYQGLLANGYRPIGEKQQQSALQQVLHYLEQNRENIRRVVDVEVDVSVEKGDYRG